jgi:aminoglycoside phosphotransferase (APT) family kinase protein
MHGDYKLDNVIFSNECPPTILSVLDFRNGHHRGSTDRPELDDDLLAGRGQHVGRSPADAQGGMDARYRQSATALIERYGQVTGRDLANLQWYQAFTAWKPAIVLEASYAKNLEGRSKNPIHQHFGPVVDDLVARARTYAE